MFNEFENVENSVFDYENMVENPGKFEGEPRYTPYFYDLMMNGEGNLTSDEFGCIVTRFNIEEADIKLFPELENYNVIDLHITDDGFVMAYFVC